MRSIAGRRRGTLLVALLATAALAGLIVALALRSERGPAADGRSASPPSTGAGSEPAIGVNMGVIFHSLALGDRQDAAASLDAARDHGVRLARVDALWEYSEPQPPRDGVHAYDWTYDDRVVTELARRNIRVQLVIGYSPQWAAAAPGALHSPPRAAADFAAYAAALARRYGPAGELWRTRPDLPRLPVTSYEVWNEPDSPQFWPPAPDPTSYAALYAASRAAIKQVQPRARVVLGGLTGDLGADFLAAVVRASPGIATQVEAVGFHPYETTPDGVYGKVRRMRATLDFLGMKEVPLAVNEFGWQDQPPTAPRYAAPDVKAAYLTRTAETLVRSNCGVSEAIIFSWTSEEANPADPDQWYGVVHRGGVETPSSRALGALLRRGVRRDGSVELCERP